MEKKKKEVKYKTNKVARLVLNGDVTGQSRYQPKYKYYQYDSLLKSPIMQFLADHKKMFPRKKFIDYVKVTQTKGKIDPYDAYQEFLEGKRRLSDDVENDDFIKKYFVNFKQDFDENLSKIEEDTNVKVVKMVFCFHGNEDQTLICAPRDCIEYIISKLSNMLDKHPDKKLYIQNVACFQANIIKDKNNDYNIKTDIEQKLGKYGDRIIYAEHNDKTTEHEIRINPAALNKGYPGGLRHKSFVYNKIENGKLVNITTGVDENNKEIIPKIIKNKILGLQEGQDTRLSPNTEI